MNSATLHKKSFIIAIDPDVDRNGVACLYPATRKIEITTMTFPELVEFILSLRDSKEEEGTDCIMVIEAGWLNHTHWHNKRGDSRRVIAAKGNSVGRNHEVGRKIAEMCEHWGIPYRLVKPLKKIWKGKDGKVTATELESFTGYKGCTNQEGRDAALLSWVYARLPIKIKRI